MVWRDMVWRGMVWHGIAWYGVAWYGMAWYDQDTRRLILKNIMLTNSIEGNHARIAWLDIK